jgi:ankyrin repeat protein
LAYCSIINFGETPLHLSAENGHLEAVQVIQQIVDYKTNYPDIAYQDSRTPLHMAAKNGHLEVVKELLEHHHGGANINPGDKEGLTPLHLSAECGSLKIVKYLLPLLGSDDQSPTDLKGQTLLDLAEVNANNDQCSERNATTLLIFKEIIPRL